MSTYPNLNCLIEIRRLFKSCTYSPNTIVLSVCLFNLLLFVFLIFILTMYYKNIPWLRSVYSFTWLISWTENSIIHWSTIKMPLVDATSATVVGVIMERQGPWGIRTWSSPTAATFTGTLALRAALDFLKTHSAHLKAWRVFMIPWLD